MHLLHKNNRVATTGTSGQKWWRAAGRRDGNSNAREGTTDDSYTPLKEEQEKKKKEGSLDFRFSYPSSQTQTQRRTNHTSHKPFLLSHLRRPTLSTPLPTALPPLPHYPQSHKPVAIIIIISRVSESRPTKARHNRRSSTATRKQNPSPLQADVVAVAAPSRPQPGPVAVAASHLMTRRCKSFPGPAPTQHGSQIDHSFPFLESLNELLKKHGWKEGTGLGISEQVLFLTLFLCLRL
ncbi:hypothetical protein RIF29_26463 [Crotalaria pallida]|uniref:G-patch domain-containing protein n=1 Tax=Crotalaria pallida TaxID=3830 RepID=A0AAN9ESS6_CROPI